MATDTVIQTSARDAYETLTKKLGQLEALLTMSYGDALESIDEMNDSLRQNYYWTCADLATDCGTLIAFLPWPEKDVMAVSHV